MKDYSVRFIRKMFKLKFETVKYNISHTYYVRKYAHHVGNNKGYLKTVLNANYYIKSSY